MKKRILTLALTLLLVLTVATPALAANETSATSTITYTVASSYTITIPSTGVTISGASASANVGVAADSIIDADKQLEFSISHSLHYSAAQGFRLVNGSDAAVFLGYTISTPADTDILKDEVFLTVLAANCYAGSTVSLTFTPDAAVQAGTYTDTITFAVATTDVTV